MVVHSPDRLSTLYDQDETAWLEAMAELVRQHRLDELDLPHLSEYLTDMARRDRREVKSRLTVLIAHILKRVHQPERRSGGWRATVEAQRQELVGLLESKTLRHHAEAVLPSAYADGVRQAAAETERPVSAFPAECPYTLDKLEGFDLLAE